MHGAILGGFKGLDTTATSSRFTAVIHVLDPTVHAAGFLAGPTLFSDTAAVFLFQAFPTSPMDQDVFGGFVAPLNPVSEVDGHAWKPINAFADF